MPNLRGVSDRRKAAQGNLWKRCLMLCPTRKIWHFYINGVWDIRNLSKFNFEMHNNIRIIYNKTTLNLEIIACFSDGAKTVFFRKHPNSSITISSVVTLVISIWKFAHAFLKTALYILMIVLPSVTKNLAYHVNIVPYNMLKTKDIVLYHPWYIY